MTFCKISLKNPLKSSACRLNWTLIFVGLGLFMAFVSRASSDQRRALYSQNQNFRNERQQAENPYPNRHQPGQGYIPNNIDNNNNLNNNNRPPFFQGSGQPQLPQRELDMRGNPSRPTQNPLMDPNANKHKFWIPTEVFEKYPYASRLTEDSARGMLLIETCIKGYGPFRRRGNTYCRPLCDNCENGNCLAPGVCECYGEFVKNDNDDCIFTCPLGCLNGKCYLDGTCLCDPGYKLDETRKFCRPICSSGCGENPNHNCTEPEVCGCAKGYRLTDEGCRPACEPDCGPGGVCIEPNTCQCPDRKIYKDAPCQDECYQKCDNGVCYAKNRCICNPGFTYHERSTQCVPV